MAKVGLDSFHLNCHTNDNISEIEAEFGVKGFAIVVRLWQKIYSEKGYYCEWIERSPLLFLSNWFGGNSGVTISLINEIVDRCLKNGIFNAQMYEEHSILTSARIQTQYFDAVKRREEILVKKEYLLVSVDKISGIVYKNKDSANINGENVCRKQQSKVKESKVKESKEKRMPHVERFEDFWNAYPLKQRRYLAEKAYCDLLIAERETEDNIISAARNYSEYLKITGDKPYYPNNWLEKCIFEDYLSGKYVKPEERHSAKNKFNQFEKNEYDFEQLEKDLLGN